MTPERDDDVLLEAFRALDPPDEAVARVEKRLPEVPARTLADEWLDLLRVRPVAHAAMAVAASAVLAVATPLGGLAALVGAWRRPD